MTTVIFSRWFLNTPVFMLRIAPTLLLLSVLGLEAEVHRSTSAAWPHRAIVTSLHERSVAFRAYTRGGTLIIAVDASGRYTTAPAPIRPLRALASTDTILAHTPADFPLDLSTGSVVFIAEGSDSLHVAVGRNPYGSIDRVTGRGRRLTLRLETDKFVIDSR